MLQEFTDALPASSSPTYDLAGGAVAFYLNKRDDGSIEILTSHGNEENKYRFTCPLFTNIATSELEGFKTYIKRNIKGTMYGLVIVDGGNVKGRGVFCIAKKGSIL